VQGGVWLYGSTSALGVFANQVTGVIASRALRLSPGRDVVWQQPFDGEEFRLWLERVGESARARPASWVVHLPADRRRRRFNLLLLDDEQQPVAFAKFTMNPLGELAVAAMARFGDEPPRSFWAPARLDAGVLGEYSYFVTTTMPNVPHRPARLPAEERRQILDELQGRLTDQAPSHQVVVHGDFAPWNVRRLRGGRLAVVDWEEVTAGPIAADDLWFLVCSRTPEEGQIESLSTYTSTELALAARFWLERLNREEPAEIDQTVAGPARLQDRAARIRRLLESLGSDR